MTNARIRELLAELGLLGKVDVVLPDGTHHYWSTHCRHDNGDGRGHRACAAREVSGRNVQDREGWSATIARTPSQCKTCSAPCACPCHKTEGNTSHGPA